LIQTVEDLAARGIALKSLNESIDTTTPSGMLTFHIFGAMAEFERSLIRERTKAGLAAAKARGRAGGRPPKLVGERLEMARGLLHAGNSVSAVARTMSVSRATVHRSMDVNEARGEKEAA
jgi:DNA invertase Pin-like site-specific DNA recombinase